MVQYIIYYNGVHYGFFIFFWHTYYLDMYTFSIQSTLVVLIFIYTVTRYRLSTKLSIANGLKKHFMC